MFSVQVCQPAEFSGFLPRFRLVARVKAGTPKASLTSYVRMFAKRGLWDGWGQQTTKHTESRERSGRAPSQRSRQCLAVCRIWVSDLGPRRLVAWSAGNLFSRPFLLFPIPFQPSFSRFTGPSSSLFFGLAAGERSWKPCPARNPGRAFRGRSRLPLHEIEAWSRDSCIARGEKVAR